MSTAAKMGSAAAASASPARAGVAATGAAFVPTWRDLGSQSGGERRKLRLVTWNILGDGPGLALSSKHDYCPLELRVWKEASEKHASRRDRTVQRLRELDGDIFCLQECTPALFEDLKAALADAYLGFHVCQFLTGAAGPKEGSSSDKLAAYYNVSDLKFPPKRGEMGNAMFFRKAAFSVSHPETLRRAAMRIGPEQEGEAGDQSAAAEAVCTSASAEPNVPKLAQVVGVFGVPYREFMEEGRHTGKLKKRLGTLEDDCILAVLELCSGAPATAGEATDLSQRQFLFLVGAHLFFDPRYPHVKACQAGIIGRVVEKFVRELVIEPGLAAGLPATDVPVELSGGANGASGANGANGQVGDDGPQSSKKKPKKNKPPPTQPTLSEMPFSMPTNCHVVVCGDFNSMPIFQPEFMDADEKEALEKPWPEDSGVFRLFSSSSLPSAHAEHPDTFGNKAALLAKQNPKAVKQSKGVGELTLRLGALANAYGSDLFPRFTTNCEDFRGCLDYVWFSGSDGGEGRSGLVREAVLEVPDADEKDYIPNADHTSDHYPLGVVFGLPGV